jgi:hypothetical protein
MDPEERAGFDALRRELIYRRKASIRRSSPLHFMLSKTVPSTAPLLSNTRHGIAAAASYGGTYNCSQTHPSVSTVISVVCGIEAGTVSPY